VTLKDNELLHVVKNRSGMEGLTQNQFNSMVNNVALTQNNNIVLLGDSIMQRNTPTGINNLNLNNDGFFTWFNFYMNNAFNVINYAGVSGETTSQIVARYNTDVKTFKPAFLCVMMGTNNLGLPLSTFKNDYKYLLNEAKNDNIHVLIFVQPAGNVNSVSKGQLYSDMLAFLKYTIPNTFNNVSIIDSDIPLNDNTGTFPVFNAAYTIDSIHPNSIGAQKIGERGKLILINEIKKRILNILPIQQGNTLSPNPTLQGNGGTKSGIVSGVTPDGFNGTGSNGTIVSSLETDENGDNWCKYTYTTNNVNEMLFYFRAASATTTGFNVGDKIQLLARFKVSPTANNFKFCVADIEMPSGTAYSTILNNTSIFSSSPIDGIIASPIITIPDAGGGLPPASLKMVIRGRLYAPTETDYVMFGQSVIFKLP